MSIVTSIKKARYKLMMINNMITTFDKSNYEIKEQDNSSIVLAKKKIILPEMDKKDIGIVNSTKGIIITDSMDMGYSLFKEKGQFIKAR